MFGALVVLAVGCQKEAAAPAPAPRRPAARPAARAKAPPALLDECRQRAARVSGKSGVVYTGPPLAEMPPTADDPFIEPSERRLLALRAIDGLSDRLRKAPRDPSLHYQLGVIYLRTLENPSAAARHLCRSLLEDPASRMYRLAVRATWMIPGLEEQLELSLEPAERNMPWREALAQVRLLKGVEWEVRAGVLEDSITAQRIMSRSRTLAPRTRVDAKPVDAVVIVERWLEEGEPGAEPWVIVSFPERLRRRVKGLLDRTADATPAEVWQTPGPGPRWLIFGHGSSSLEPVLRVAASRVPRQRVGVSVRSRGRRLYLIGRFDRRGFTVQNIAATTDVEMVRELVSK